MEKRTKKTLVFILLGVALAAGLCMALTGFFVGRRFAFAAKEYFEEETLFHDQADIYMTPLEPNGEEEVTFRIKAKYGQATAIALEYTFDVLSTAVNVTWHRAPMAFEKRDETGKFEYWVGRVPANDAPYKYHFRLENRAETIWYNADGISEEAPTGNNGDWYVMPNFETPDWAKGALWYSIMPESFYNGDVTNDKTGSLFQTAWGNANSWAGEWFGGDLGGIADKLEYLNEMGVDSLFFNPIWVTDHNAGYGSYDFTQIDSSLGNDETLKALVDSLHDADMQLMLDAVFEYVSINNIVFNLTERYPDLIPHSEIGDEFYDFVQRDEDGEPLYSVWGSPLIDFSKLTAREFIYESLGSILQMYVAEYGIDGWRMDVGNTLSGSDSENWGNATQILKDIRRYLKGVKEDLLYLSEHADANQLTDYILDTKWNYAFYYPVVDWAKGLSNATVLRNMLRSAVLTLPRSVANVSYNFLTTHDMPRLYDLIQGDDVKFGAAEILLFTYVGAPCIYFGEEIGLGGEKVISEDELSFFTSMNWDESTWNYYIYHLVSALSDLRKEYPAVFSEGGMMDLLYRAKENPNDLYAYGRFAGSDVAITVVSQNKLIIFGQELSVAKLGLKDGCILTDYLSGREYIVRNGKVSVDVYPCGSVFVTGGAGAYVGTYEKLFLGNPEGSIRRGDEPDSYLLSGSATLGKTDDVAFVTLPGFNNCEIEGLVEGSGRALFAIRADGRADAPFYGAVIGGGEARLIWRDLRGGQVSYGNSVAVSDSVRVNILRGDDNRFSVLLNGKEEKSFRKHVEMGYEVKLGIAPYSGSTTVRELRVGACAEQYAASFDDSIGSLFDIVGSGDVTLTGTGELSIFDEAEGTYVLTQAHMSDFTHRALLNAVPVEQGDIAGIFSGRQNDFIFLGHRMGVEGTELVFGHYTQGELAVYGSTIHDAGKIWLQLEKSGSFHRGLYSTDGVHFEELGRLNRNYADYDVGLVNIGSAELQCDWWRFGDGNGLSDHYFEGALDFGFTDYERNNLVTNYHVSDAGKWSYVQAGIRQDDVTAGETMYSFASRVEDFRAVFTYRLFDVSQNGFAGLRFGRTSETASGGYLLRFDDTGKVRLLSPAGTELAVGNVTGLADGGKASLVFEVQGKTAVLYAAGKPVLQTSEIGAHAGWFGWTGCRAGYEILNYNLFAATGNWQVLRGTFNSYQNENFADRIDVELSAANEVNYAAMRGDAVGDFALGFNLQMQRINPIRRSYFDYHIGSSSGSDYLSDGLIVRFDDRGHVTILENGIEMRTFEDTGIQVSSVYLLLIYREKTLTLLQAPYVAGKTSYASADLVKVFEYEPERGYTGAPALYSQNCGVRLAGINGYGLSAGTDPATLDVFEHFFVEEPMPDQPEVNSGMAEEDVSVDFSEKSDLGRFLRYGGVSRIREGKLILDSGSNWDAGIALAAGRYQNFEATVRMRVTDSSEGRFGGIEFYKSTPSANHQGSALTLVVYADGSVNLFVGNGMMSSYSVPGEPDSEGFVTVNLQVKDGVIVFGVGTRRATARIANLNNNDHLTDGYLSLNAGATKVEFDSFSVRRI